MTATIDIADGLLMQDRLAGPRVHDARIAASCLQHGVAELRSADRDFIRFEALRAVNPLMQLRASGRREEGAPSFLATVRV